MIIRAWEGRTFIEGGDAYEQFMIDRAAPDYASVDGLKSLFFCRRDDDAYARFLLLTHWRSWDAVQAFAPRQNPSSAKYYPEDDRYLIEKPARAANYRVFHSLLM